MAKKRTATNRYYPVSGILVGELARCLRVSERPDEDAVSKRRSRWFAGSKDIAPDARAELLGALVDDVFAGIASNAGGEASDALDAARVGAIDFFDLYDRVVTRLAGHSPEPPGHSYSLFPFLRLAVLELGVRAAAFCALVEPTEDALPAVEWSQRPALRAVMDRYRDDDSSLDTIAARIEVAATTLDEWRSGHVLAQRRHLELLAEELASMGKAGEQTILFDLRLAAARDELYRRTSPYLGSGDLASRSLGHFLETSHRVRRLFLPGMRRLLVTTPDSRHAVLAVVAHGWRAEIPRTALAPILAALGEVHQDGELVADLHHLADDRFVAERALYWTKYAAAAGASTEAIGEAFASYGGKPERLLEQWDDLLPHVVAMCFRFSPFDTEPVAQRYSLPLPRPVQAMFRSGPWNAAMSRGDYVAAASLARRSVADVPLVAIHHFELGASLGQLVRIGALHVVDEAIAECRIAFELDPKHLRARNEVAVILSNAKLYSAALEEYAQAAAHCETLGLFHSGRGWVLLALNRLEESADAFQASLLIEPENVDAMARLAAIQLQLGRTTEGRRLAREVRHLTRNQLDPERDRAQLLRVD